MKTLYQTSATVTGGRNGSVKSEDGVLQLEVRIPKEMGGNQTGFTNPEQLFAAGYAACFDSALNGIISREKVQTTGPSSIKATVGLYQNESHGYGLQVALEGNIPGVDAETAKSLMEKAHQVCPYSNATRGNIDVQLSVA